MSRGKHARPAGSKPSEEQSAKHAANVSSEKTATDAEEAVFSEGSSELETPVVSDAPETANVVSPAFSAPMMPVVPMQAPLPEGFAEGAAAELKRRRRKKALKVFGIVLGVIVALLLAAYVAVAVVFMGRFFPNTTVGSADISLKSADEVRVMLEEHAAGYKVNVSAKGLNDNFSLALTAEEMGLEFDGNAVVQSILNTSNPWLWPLELTKKHDVSEGLVANTKGDALAQAVSAAVEAANVEATEPTDAEVSYSAEQHAFIVAPEEYGTMMNTEATLREISEGIAILESSIELTTDSLEQPTVYSDDATLVCSAGEANKLLLADASFTMGDEVAAKVDPDSISGWVVFDEDMTPSISEEKMLAWVDDIVATRSTADGERTYTRADGKEITVSGGSYGWTVDHDAFLAMVRSVMENQERGVTYEMPCTKTAQTWKPGGRDWGRYIDVDLTEQHARFYDENDNIIWESDIVTGKPSTPTPEGVWTCLELDEYRTLRGPKQDDGTYEWESPVRYWMRLTWSGVGFHDATWQAAFGGSRWKSGYGSHGCINLPYGKAAELFGLIQLHDVAVVHY